jgi:hypothetical protein
MPLPAMIDPKNAVFEFKCPTVRRPTAKVIKRPGARPSRIAATARTERK